MRTFKPFPWWKQIIWKLFGVKRIGHDSGATATGYYFCGIYYVEIKNEKRN